MTVSAGSADGLPFGIEDRHRAPRTEWLWPRRVLLVVLTAVLVAALANVFGQRQTITTVDASAAALTVDSPERLRGGLIFTSRYTVLAHQPIQDLRLVLAPGWWHGMTLNAEAPNPGSEGSNSLGVVLDYGQINAGQSIDSWISWQVNPTTYGIRDETVYVFDGARLLLQMPRTLVIFP